MPGIIQNGGWLANLPIAEVFTPHIFLYQGVPSVEGIIVMSLNHVIVKTTDVCIV